MFNSIFSDKELFSNNYFSYFSKEESSDLLERVPTCFLIIGACYAILQLIGALMLSEPKVYTKHEVSAHWAFINTDMKMFHQ